MGISSVALADHEEPRDEDTIVSFGYDSTNHILAINSGDNDTPWICDFEDGPLTATYGEIIDGFLTIEMLQSEGEDWEFQPRDEDEVSVDYDAAEEATAYTGSDGECGLSGASIDGHFNHGQFMKTAIDLLDMKGHGCIVSEFAKSTIGRTDETMLKTSDVEEGFEPGEEGEITFQTFEADCSKPNEKGGNGERGKSADAPGHNKGN